jgi:hypothetical protein
MAISCLRISPQASQKTDSSVDRTALSELGGRYGLNIVLVHCDQCGEKARSREWIWGRTARPSWASEETIMILPVRFMSSNVPNAEFELRQ